MSAANETMKKLRLTADDRKKADPADFYVKLMIYRQKRHLLTIILLAFAVLVFVVSSQELHSGHHWLVWSLPLIGVGLLISLVPPTEEWVYRPWQTQARQYEQHQTEKRR